MSICIGLIAFVVIGSFTEISWTANKQPSSPQHQNSAVSQQPLFFPNTQSHIQPFHSFNLTSMQQHQMMSICQSCNQPLWNNHIYPPYSYPLQQHQTAPIVNVFNTSNATNQQASTQTTDANAANQIETDQNTAQTASPTQEHTNTTNQETSQENKQDNEQKNNQKNEQENTQKNEQDNSNNTPPPSAPPKTFANQCGDFFVGTLSLAEHNSRSLFILGLLCGGGYLWYIISSAHALMRNTLAWGNWRSDLDYMQLATTPQIRLLDDLILEMAIRYIDAEGTSSIEQLRKKFFEVIAHEQKILLRYLRLTKLVNFRFLAWTLGTSCASIKKAKQHLKRLIFLERSMKVYMGQQIQQMYSSAAQG